VAGFALGRKTGGGVVDDLSLVVIGLVATDAPGVQRREGAVGVVGMAADAIELGVCAGQREARLRVERDPLDILEEVRIVAVDAVFRERSLVNVYVAGGAVSGCSVRFLEF